MQRLFTVIALAAAFIVMASVFVPERARMVEGADGGVLPRPHSQRPTPRADEASADPHEGLSCLGELRDVRYTVKIYATESGALYSVYSSEGTELGVLLTSAQVERRFPDLRVSTTDFSAPTSDFAAPDGGEPRRQFMRADPLEDDVR